MTAATLADLDRHDADLLFWCRSCGHHVTMPIKVAMAFYGADREISSIKGRCIECGSRDVDVRPDWRPKGAPVTRP